MKWTIDRGLVLRNEASASVGCAEARVESKGNALDLLVRPTLTWSQEVWIRTERMKSWMQVASFVRRLGSAVEIKAMHRKESVEMVGASDCDAALWRFPGHTALGRDLRADPEHSGEIMNPFWSGNTLEPPTSQEESESVVGTREAWAPLLDLLPPRLWIHGKG